MKIQDRLVIAQELSAEKCVVDIGAAWPLRSDVAHGIFGKMYRKISNCAKSYMVIDYHKIYDRSSIQLDLNTKQGLRDLEQALLTTCNPPDVILCMETLEHLAYPTEIMDMIADSITNNGGMAFITIPNGTNWLMNAIGFDGGDHSYTFHKHMALNFIKRSRLGNHDVEIIPCIGKYKWWWRLFYLASFCQPVSWGFIIKRKVLLTF